MACRDRRLEFGQADTVIATRVIFLLFAATHTKSTPSNRRADLVPPQSRQREVGVSTPDQPGLTVAAIAEASFFTQGRI